jgi:hypothetical protein
MGKLTATIIEKAKTDGEKTRKLFDGGGLFLELATSGGKLWRYQYRFEGKRKLLALGKYPDISLQKARKRHQEARTQLANGIDPSAAKRAKKAVASVKPVHEILAVLRRIEARMFPDS